MPQQYVHNSRTSISIFNINVHKLSTNFRRFRSIAISTVKILYVHDFRTSSVPNCGKFLPNGRFHFNSSHFISLHLLSSLHFDTHLRLLRFILQLITWSRISIYWVLFRFRFHCWRDRCKNWRTSFYGFAWLLNFQRRNWIPMCWYINQQED